VLGAAKPEFFNPVMQTCLGGPIDKVTVPMATLTIAVEKWLASLLYIAFELNPIPHANVVWIQEKKGQGIAEIAFTREGYDTCEPTQVLK
jgi:hypothetical protein